MKLLMRRWLAAAMLAVSLGTSFFCPSLSRAEGQSDRNRKVVNKVMPVYPDLARRLQMRGTVRIQAVVAPNGSVKSTQVLGGSPLLVNAAQDAVGRWKWTPAPQETKELIELSFHP
jgi:TonB family protein